MSHSKELLADKQQQKNEELDFKFGEREFYLKECRLSLSKICIDCKITRVEGKELFCEPCQKRGEELFEQGRGN